MKHIWLTAVTILLTLTTRAQTDFSPYFRLDVSLRPDSSKAVSVELVSIKHDRIAKFVNKHANRFQYFLLHGIGPTTAFTKYYPDSAAVNEHFRAYIKNDSNISDGLNILIGHTQDKQQYTIAEMMHVASRFFMCDTVYRPDTTVGVHVCIGQNGQKEIRSGKDRILLEAFCFDAIFYYFNKSRHDPVFYQHFNQYIQHARRSAPFTNWHAYLQVIKNMCYTNMEHDAALQTALMKYYSKNRRNIGFVIQ